jgi:hypothetical protein
MLKEKIIGHIPTGLNKDVYTAFTCISFDLVNPSQLETYGISCTVINDNNILENPTGERL